MLHTGVGPPLKYSNMKIKVVDVETQPQGEEQLATIDEAEEDYNSSKTLSSSSKEEDVPEQKPPGEEEEHVLPSSGQDTNPTKQRVQQLHKCEKCGKMLTLKSLRYSHSKYCGKVSEPVESKMKPEPQVRVKHTATPVNEPPPVKEKTFDEMRKERLEQRRTAHKESIQKLFAKAF